MSGRERPARRALLGFDVGGTNVRVAVARGGEPRAGGTVPLPADYRRLLGELERLARAAAEDSAPAAIGIGLPGVVRGNTATWVPNVPFVVHEPLAEELGERLDAPVYLANDAQTALLGEARFGAARALRSAALISLGTGVGGAILVGDRVLRGAHGAAGSFGWVNVDASGIHDADHGQLELLASGRALDVAAREPSASGRRYRNAFALVEAARAGDVEAQRRVAELGRWLGAAIATLASTLDPEVVLVSGGVSEAFDVLDPAVREAIAELASPSARTIPVRVAALGSRAGVWGAVALAAEGEEAFVL